MKEIRIPSSDGIHNLHVVIWEPEGKVRGVIQISHGMTEMIIRYAHFAEYLNKKGYVVIGNDHIGHGETAGCDEDLGYFCPKNMSETVVNDLHKVTAYAKKEYQNLPYFLIGHSMGSFMARRYLMTYGKELDGAVIVGTGKQPGGALVFGNMVASIIKCVKGERHRSKLLKAVCFGNYDSRVKAQGAVGNWLTKDEEIVHFCSTNKYCNFSFTVNGYQTLFEVLTFIQNRRNIEQIPKTLPIFMVAGDEDPVGNYGKGVQAVYESYKTAGIEDIALKLYKGDRHEILNELDKEQVYADILQWIEKRIEKKSIER